MHALGWLVPAFPLVGFLILTFAGGLLSRKLIAWVAVGAVGLSAVAGTWLATAWRSVVSQGELLHLWRWVVASGLNVDLALRFDGLSLAMVLVVTWVGFMIHVYAAGSMREEGGYRRFFAYMNLFVAAMLLLVLADDLLAVLLGWEGVGLCSYLLIGFWYQDPANGRAARKAFVVTRVGDAALMVGLFLIAKDLGTLDIPSVLAAAPRRWGVGSPAAVAAAALILAGAIGKSAQVPLHVWLPDAMAGPTPVSALIHAATMVTAGVYLVARLHGLFVLAPGVMIAAGWIGAVTLLIASVCALSETDIKRVLAYSTMSQVGYMFVALGAGAWELSIFHLATHACFKSLLFLGAGVVIQCLDGEHRITSMGGLRQRLPLTFWTFLIGAASLAALPLVTAGFYSKDRILAAAWEAGHRGLWAVALLGTLLTAVYTSRLVLLVFFGKAQRAAKAEPRTAWVALPLFVLAALSLVGGVFGIFVPEKAPTAAGPAAVAAAAAVVGIALGIGIYRRRWSYLPRSLASSASVGFGFDRLYDVGLVRPFRALAELLRRDPVDSAVDASTRLVRAASHVISGTETGVLRWYATCIMGGVVLYALLAVWL